MTSKREGESVAAILMLLAGIFLLLRPLQSFADALQRGRFNLGGSLVELLFALAAFAAFAITWKGNSTAGGLVSLVVSLYLLFVGGISGQFATIAVAFLLAAGILAMLAGRTPIIAYPQR